MNTFTSEMMLSLTKTFQKGCCRLKSLHAAAMRFHTFFCLASLSYSCMIILFSFEPCPADLSYRYNVSNVPTPEASILNFSIMIIYCQQCHACLFFREKVPADLRQWAATGSSKWGWASPSCPSFAPHIIWTGLPGIYKARAAFCSWSSCVDWNW